MKRILPICLSLAHTGIAAAAEQAPLFAAPGATESSMPSAAGSLLEVTVSLAIVLAAIVACAWAVRRMRSFGRPAAAALDVIADVPLGPKERAVLIKVGDTQLLLGVAPGRVNTLHVLTEPVSIETLESKAGTTSDGVLSFRSLLMKSLGKS